MELSPSSEIIPSEATLKKFPTFYRNMEVY
jgi:hypothetical protein